jgi:hypothetical protein
MAIPLSQFRLAEEEKLNRGDRGARRELTKGIMEEWNIGMVGKKWST